MNFAAGCDDVFEKKRARLRAHSNCMFRAAMFRRERLFLPERKASAALVTEGSLQGGGTAMRTFAIALLAGASALAATSVARADEITTMDGVQQARLVCNDYGRCWHEPSDRVIIHRDVYPRDRYYYGHDYYRDRPGIGFNAPGVHIGVGPGY
jgi:hypothetical protein